MPPCEYGSTISNMVVLVTIPVDATTKNVCCSKYFHLLLSLWSNNLSPKSYPLVLQSLLIVKAFITEFLTFLLSFYIPIKKILMTILLLAILILKNPAIKESITLQKQKQQNCITWNIFSKLNKLEAQWAEPVSLTFHSPLRKLNTEPSIGASHQISVHFGKAVSEKNIFRNRPIYNKNCLFVNGSKRNEQSL